MLEEVLVAKDFGKVLAKLLLAGNLTNTFLAKLTPKKSLVALAHHWGCNGGCFLQQESVSRELVERVTKKETEGGQQQ